MTEFVPSQSSSLDDWLSYLEGIHPQNIDMGLTRVKHVADKMGYLSLSSNILLIAGTNGKGTTARCLEAMLLAQGYSVGTYASPHLVRYNERVRFNGKELADHYHVNAFSALESGRGETSLTYFEYGTLGALEIFKQLVPDFILLEVGLGGRLDATNIVEPMASVITTVDLDHKDYLGDTRELVGYEKAGIFRANKPAIIGDLDIPKSMIEHGLSINAQMTKANVDYQFKDDGEAFHYHSDTLTLDCSSPAIPAQNVATALTTLQKIDLLPSNEVIVEVLANLAVEGRFQPLSKQPLVFADVAHNPESARYLASKLAYYKAKGKEVVALAGMLEDKDQASVYEALKSHVDKWSVASLSCFRGATAAYTQAQAHSVGIENVSCYESVEVALNQILPTISSDQLLIVFGSFYTVADAIHFWQKPE